MSKIIGNTVGTTMLRPNWVETDENSSAYIGNKPTANDGNFLVGNGEGNLREMTPSEVLSHINGASVATLTTAEYDALVDAEQTNANVLYMITDAEEEDKIKLDYLYGDYSEGLEYTLSDDGTYYSVTGIGECTDTYIKIPPLYEGKPVTSIGDDAFSSCDRLTSVVIPDSVTSIGKHAFSGCFLLARVKMGDSVTSIGNYAFNGCQNLTSIAIPDSVTSIGDAAFYYCYNLTSVVIPDSVTSIGSSAFMYCKNLTSVVIPDSVTSIGDQVLQSCTSLQSVVIPDSITSIGDQAFLECSNLISVTIPDSVTSIGERAFYGCSSLTIYCEASDQGGNWVTNWNPDERPVVWNCALDFAKVNDKINEAKGYTDTKTADLDSTIAKQIDGLSKSIPTNVSDLSNDAGYLTAKVEVKKEDGSIKSNYSIDGIVFELSEDGTTLNIRTTTPSATL